ncbi:MAG: translation elongation factor Ts [Paludibacteraceae bacterium]|nr:translation elongation factor Ts [Paludibacteraceae bacterium]
MAVTMEEIKKLRTMTGAGMMDCKNALNESAGDMEKAIELIRKRGQAIAAKRSDRAASEGCVLAGVKEGFAAVVAVKCETDFVAKNADFVALTQNVLNLALAEKPASMDALLAAKIEGRTVADLITERSGVTGEKMELGYYEFVKGAYSVEYMHPGNKLATIVAFAEENVDRQVARDIAMQAAAMNPVALNRDEVPEDIKAKELEIGKEKAREEGKPEAILERIALGRLDKFFKESTLMEQEFIKDSKQSVTDYCKANKVTPIAFKRVNLNQD